MKVGLIGAFLNNSNMGCVALACSVIRLLQEIEEEEEIKLDITLFEASPGKEKLKLYIDKKSGKKYTKKSNF